VIVGSNKRKEHISHISSTDSVKKVCKDNEKLDSVVGNVQIDTVTYSDDQKLTDMVILDNTDTLNDNDHQELTDMVILDNPQTERVSDSSDRETSGSNDPQNCMNTVTVSEEFAYRTGSYVDLCLDNRSINM
jgi:hypothetical protein